MRIFETITQTFIVAQALFQLDQSEQLAQTLSSLLGDDLSRQQLALDNN